MKPSISRISKFAALPAATALGLAIYMMPATPVKATAVIAATEPTQILNNIQLGASYIEQVTGTIQKATMILNQINAYKNMLQNTKQLLAAKFAPLTTALANLKSVVSEAKGLAYTAANIDTLFSATHKGYSDYATTEIGAGGYATAYQNWQKLHTESSVAALKELKLQEENFADEATTIDTIQSHLSTPEGTVQAIQTGSEIGLQQINQLQMLRKLMMSQQQTQVRYAAIEQERKELQAAQSALLGKGTTASVGDEKTF